MPVRVAKVGSKVLLNGIFETVKEQELAMPEEISAWFVAKTGATEKDDGIGR